MTAAAPLGFEAPRDQQRGVPPGDFRRTPATVVEHLDELSTEQLREALLGLDPGERQRIGRMLAMLDEAKQARGTIPYRYQVINAVRADRRLPGKVKEVFYAFAIDADLATGIVEGITARVHGRHLNRTRRTAFAHWHLLRANGLVRRAHHWQADRRHPDWPDGRANSWILCYPGLAWPVAFAIEPEPYPHTYRMPAGCPVNLSPGQAALRGIEDGTPAGSGPSDPGPPNPRPSGSVPTTSDPPSSPPATSAPTISESPSSPPTTSAPTTSDPPNAPPATSAPTISESPSSPPATSAPTASTASLPATSSSPRPATPAFAPLPPRRHGSALCIEAHEILALLRRMPEMGELASDHFARRAWTAGQSQGVGLATAIGALCQAWAQMPLCNDEGEVLEGNALKSKVIAFILAAGARAPLGDGFAFSGLAAHYPEELELDATWVHRKLPQVMGGRSLAAALGLVRATLDEAGQRELRGKELQRHLLEVMGAPRGATAPTPRSTPVRPTETPGDRASRERAIQTLAGLDPEWASLLRPK
jgi:hypothetical protein